MDGNFFCKSQSSKIIKSQGKSLIDTKIYKSYNNFKCHRSKNGTIDGSSVNNYC